MKKIISYILLTALLVLQFSGCGARDEKESTGASNTGETQGDGSGNRQDEPAESDSLMGDLSVLESSGQDNSRDAYSAVVNAPLRGENAVRSTGGTSKVFLGASRAYCFVKHLSEKPSECWDELSFMTADGETDTKSFDLENQLWQIGAAAGTDHYVTFDCEVQGSEENYCYFLTERDGNHEGLREFPLHFLDGWDFAEAVTAILDFAVDYSGAAHVVWQTAEEQQYLILSSEGEILTEGVPDGNARELVPLNDGRVALCVTKWNDEAQSIRASLQLMDAEAGRLAVLAAPEMDTYYFTLLDENTLVYADQEGVYRSGLSGNNAEILYRWSYHGIAVEGISAMQADGEGRIVLVYQDSQDYNYLCLEPTTENVEICEITMAVSPARMDFYKPLVVEFNKRYPGCFIELKSDYDETALLTELIAGRGPVLVDTYVIRFEDQEKLWEPLDVFIEQLGVADELFPSTLEMGRINGTLYGIVTDFRLRTLVTGDWELKDWDYDTFLQCIEERPELEGIFNFYGGDYGPYFIMNILGHGIDDTYLFDAEAGTTNFDSSEFRKALEMAKKYCVREEGIKPGSSLLEGKVLCNELYIGKPESLALYRSCYGEDANYIGYPTKNGATHFVESNGSPLTIRRTATREEKAAAAAFINLCLSYEGQSLAAKDLNFELSARRDVLEEQIAAMNETTDVFVSGFDQFILGDDLNIELDRKTLLDMIESARPVKYFPTELREIMYEELEQYFSGKISEDKLIDNLDSRVGLYLGERN